MIGKTQTLCLPRRVPIPQSFLHPSLTWGRSTLVLPHRSTRAVIGSTGSDRVSFYPGGTEDLCLALPAFHLYTETRPRDVGISLFASLLLSPRFLSDSSKPPLLASPLFQCRWIFPRGHQVPKRPQIQAQFSLPALMTPPPFLRSTAISGPPSRSINTTPPPLTACGHPMVMGLDFHRATQTCCSSGTTHRWEDLEVM